ncbi:endonuclease/exonuclease/phosphatase family protein [Flavobacteriaceae bacterium]|nr:endonuclease/exonuclease/phosphatase family protein [Flavobacteriaceae bacterium]
MKKLILKLIIVVFLIGNCLFSQNERKFKIHTVAFYNVENLFDTINDTNKNDEASPMMEINYNRGNIYKQKVKNMAKVISDIGKEDTNKHPAIVGLSEVENKQVIIDLINDPSLSSSNYNIIHYESPDKRGIDVAMIYDESIFKPTSTKSLELLIYDDQTNERIYTRDQLLVSGKLDGDLIHIIVNHWPSRSGGEARSVSKRESAARLNKKIIDSLHKLDRNAKIITMGDFNDDPMNNSIKVIIGAKKNKEDVKIRGMYNPMEKILTNEGIGSNSYRDKWFLFDQVIISKGLLGDDFSSYKFYKAGVFNKPYLTQKEGRYKGQPFRSFSWGKFTNGFSDHYPSFIYLIKETK